MNEEQSQKYVNLIEELLNCPQGEEPNILQENEELINQEFIQVVNQYADWLEEQQPEGNNAAWLRNMAQGLTEYVNRPKNKINEEQLQKYVNLIEELLNCPQGEELNILQENEGLINQEFIQVVNQYADWLEQEQPEGNNAGWLRNLILKEYTKRKGNNIEDYQNFFLEVLQAEWDSDSDRKVVYPILQQHQHLLDDVFAQVLRQWTKNAVSQSNSEDASAIAEVIENLCIDIKNFPLGSRANNLEIAIEGYETLLEMRPRATMAEEWAQTQYNLGIAYRGRIRGERADNLEIAIAAYEKSLEVYTCSAFPEQWAITQNNLGTAYSQRIRGERADNLEIAIAAYEKSLEVYTCSAFPEQWAMTQNNLGEAYHQRIRGEKFQNLESAIQIYEQCLEVYTRDGFPEQWAHTQDDLGKAYSDRIRGERADNLEVAILAFQRSLEVRNRDAFPEDWAMTQNNLGNAYRGRIRGEKAENVEKAILAYQSSLEVYTRTAFPYEWARSKNNLGNAYSQRIRGERADNLEKAIKAYHSSLEVYTRSAFPEDWAMTQNNLGEAYRQRIRGERADNLEKAIKAYEQSLEVYTRDAFPYEWAGTQNNLGNAYRGRIRGERAQNIEAAISAYEQSLEVYIPTAFPLDCLQTGQNLGNIAKEEKDWEMAMEGYGKAIAGVEQSRDWAITQYSKTEIQADAIDVYHQMIEVCCEAGQLDRAFTTVESNKSRYLVELLAATTVNIPDTATDDQRQVYQAYQQLRRRLEISGLESGNSEELKGERVQLNGLLNQIKSFDPNFTVTQQVERIKLSEIQGILDSETVIWEWYISYDKFYCFLITQNAIDVVISNEQQLDKLIDWAKSYFDIYNSRNWDTLPEKLGNFWEILLLPQLLEKTPKHCDKLILIPHQYLHLFPIHAVYNPESHVSLAERFKQGIQYSPSCQLLQKIEEKSRKRQAQEPLFFGIQNPTEDLFYGGLEVEIIEDNFKPDSFVLKEKEASKTKLLEANNIQKLRRSRYVHFSCHGSFNFDLPLESYLVLAGETDKNSLDEKETKRLKDELFVKDENNEIKNIQILTLKDIFEKINLPQCELVILSACQTGVTRFNKGVDEYIGLGSGFLYAGSLHVINSLWSVGEFSTAILMIRFYELMLDRENPLSIHLALQKAQKWMKSKTKKEIIDWLNSLQFKDEEMSKEMILYLKLYYDDNPPFKHPKYWAAFCSLGKVESTMDNG